MITVSKHLCTMAYLLVSTTLLVSSCGVIIGGSKYYAHVTVENHPKAEISFEGKSQGVGTVDFLAQRKYADLFSISVKEPGCREQVFDFTEKSFRGWSLVGTLATWTGGVGGIPVPWGLMVDGASGSFWKPDIYEEGVSKIDYQNYHYNLNYTGCEDKKTVTTKEIRSKTKRLMELKKLLDQGILTHREFNKEKRKILAE